MLWAYKIFDIIFLDWFLLTKTHFYQHYFPETRDCKSFKQYGFNKKQQIMKLILFQFIALIFAGIATLF